jgi:tetratricopeptide (TPR) repeat protein
MSDIRTPSPPGALAKAFSTAFGEHKAGKLREAEQKYREILERSPEHPDVLNMLGVVAGQRSQPDLAVDWFQRAIRADNENPVFHYNLAMARQTMDDLDAAAADYGRALAINPDYADALKGLGSVLMRQNKLAEAEECCRKVIGLTPDDPRAHNNLSAVLRGRGANDEATACAREALRRKPDYAEAHNNLGTILLVDKAYAAAADAFREAIHYAPKFPDARVNLATALLGLGRHTEATASLREAIAMVPSHAIAHNNLANAYRELDYREEARQEFEAALALNPGLTSARFGLAGMLLDMGDFDGALAQFDEMLRRQPESRLALSGKAAAFALKGDNDACYAVLRPLIDGGESTPEVAAIFGRIAGQLGRRDDAIALIESLLTRHDGAEMVDRQRSLLEFALGDLYDGKNDFDEAFTHFAAANALRPSGFDPVAFAAKTNRIIDLYGKGQVDRMSRATNRSDLPVFIVGMPRSGTSLVEQILASHPMVFGAGEPDKIVRYVRSFGGSGVESPEYVADFADIDAARLDSMAHEHLAYLGDLGGDAVRVTDKLPYNFQHLGFIAQLFPNSRIVHCVRDPLDTCLSCYFQDFSRTNFHTYDLRHLGAYYRQYARLMRHWHGVLDLPILDLSYEDLVADLEGASRKLVDFIGLDWDPRCLRFYEAERTVSTASSGQVRQPIYTRSVGRWRRYERHLGPLREALASGA